MPRTYSQTLRDPRDPDGELTLVVEYTARKGTPDTYFEPGDPPEYELEEAVDICGVDVLPSLDADQGHALWEQVAEGHDWSDDCRDDY